MLVELCPSCTLAIYLGFGHQDVVDALWRKFGGQIRVDARTPITTFRSCGGCGYDATSVRYLAETPGGDDNG